MHHKLTRDGLRNRIEDAFRTAVAVKNASFPPVAETDQYLRAIRVARLEAALAACSMLDLSFTALGYFVGGDPCDIETNTIVDELTRVTDDDLKVAAGLLEVAQAFIRVIDTQFDRIQTEPDPLYPPADETIARLLDNHVPYFADGIAKCGSLLAHRHARDPNRDALPSQYAIGEGAVRLFDQLVAVTEIAHGNVPSGDDADVAFVVLSGPAALALGELRLVCPEEEPARAPGAVPEPGIYKAPELRLVVPDPAPEVTARPEPTKTHRLRVFDGPEGKTSGRRKGAWQAPELTVVGERVSAEVRHHRGSRPRRATPHLRLVQAESQEPSVGPADATDVVPLRLFVPASEMAALDALIEAADPLEFSDEDFSAGPEDGIGYDLYEVTSAGTRHGALLAGVEIRRALGAVLAYWERSLKF